MQRERQLADFVEENRTLVGGLEQTDLVLSGTGKGTPLVAEQFAFEQIFRQRAAVDRQKTIVGAFRGEMNRARDQFLAGARFAGDQHARIGARDFFHHAEDALDGVAFADDALEAILLAQFLAQKSILAEQRLALERVAHDLFQMIVGERLGDVIVGALMQRLDRGFDARVGGDDDAHHLGVELAHPAQQIESAAAAGEVEVQDREIDFFLLEDSQRDFSGRRFHDFVAFAARELHDDRTHQRLVFDHQEPVRSAVLRGPRCVVGVHGQAAV